MWAVATGVATVAVATMGVAQPAVATQMEAAARVDAALVDTGRLVSTSWRSDLLPALRALPQWRETRTVSGPLSGRVVAGTVRLPATVEVTADTTIVADRVEFAGRTVSIVTRGNDFRLLPVTAVQGGGAVAKANVSAVSVITINTSGGEGQTGGPGTRSGNDAPDGNRGADAVPDLNSCTNFQGGTGGAGGTGGTGDSGRPGSAGTDAGAIVLDIPDGSQDSYVLIARGGRGGAGGTGGPGGRGGDGGDGGNGGSNSQVGCNFGLGGNGGNGGQGGHSGKGGTGGSGGNGGNGGNVNIVYPPGFDRSRVTKDLAGGLGGSGGTPGPSGGPGLGGQGGFGGFGIAGSGSPGFPGLSGIVLAGDAGGNGQAGADGQETTNPVTTVRTDRSSYLVGERTVYTVSGPPNTPILWSSTRDGAAVEDRANYGHVTDGQGRWSGTGDAWTDAQAGRWVKQVQVGTETASVTFEVRRSGAWMTWSPLGGAITERIASTEYPGLTTDIAFGRGTDGAVFYNLSDNFSSTWSGWRFANGYFTSAPVAVSDINSPFVFGRGTDGAVHYSAFFTTGPVGWHSLGGFIEGTPAVVRVGSSFMVVARAGTTVYANTYLGLDNWSGWQSLGGQAASDPTIVARDPGMAEVYVRNTAGGISTIMWNGMIWGDWQHLGGSVQGNPAAVTATSYNPSTVTRTLVFARGSTNALLVNVFDGANWTGWQDLGGTITGDPTARGDNFPSYSVVVVDVVARGTDAGIYHQRWTPWDNVWSGWRSLAGSTDLPVGFTSIGWYVLAVDRTTLAPYVRHVLD